ncbi:hypothetical protein COU55_02105 [Candidatus Pacearchaeota archaeon CG10_big_fil_rev_8_21_14_0_10_31_59]|nr:MAG: hypothetical protein COU55_02105 [Candidatus Pacearchaeota archaeon CG10_big_fil_rev_8_21_14_0_10_31_59]
MRGEAKKKSQGAIEFVIIFGSVLFFFAVFFSVVQNNIEKKNSEKEDLLLQNIVLNVKEEIELATRSSDGYFREFKIQGNILGKDYEINNTESFVYASIGKKGISYEILDVTGNIKKGSNNITKQNGRVYVN